MRVVWWWNGTLQKMRLSARESCNGTKLHASSNVEELCFASSCLLQAATQQQSGRGPVSHSSFSARFFHINEKIQ